MSDSQNCLPAQFHPISLYNTIYMLINKIIVNRIKPLLHKFIHPSQSALQHNRRASDNALIVQELLYHLKTSKSKYSKMLLKIDRENAFDRLEWSFIKLLKMLLYHFRMRLIVQVLYVTP